MSFEQKCCIRCGNEPRILVTDEFIEKNKFSINIEEAKESFDDKRDFFGFKAEVAIDFLPFDQARPYLKEEYIKKVESGEVNHTYVSDVAEAVQDFLDYMVFAWMKAMDERGIFASRSIEKLSTWMKILNRPDVAAILDKNSLYSPYGRPALRKACDVLGIKYPDYL